MNPYWLQITDLKYFWKILTYQNPQARWIYFINVPLCRNFSKLVSFGGSLFHRDICDLWSANNMDSCIKHYGLRWNISQIEWPSLGLGFLKMARWELFKMLKIELIEVAVSEISICTFWGIKMKVVRFC